MPNLSSLLSTSAEDAKRPVPLPDGTYYGIIKSFNNMESKNINKDTGEKTPGLSFRIELTHPHPDVDLSEYEAAGGKPINTRSFTHDIYITENSLWRLKEFLESLGLDLTGRSLGEMIPSTVNQAVLLDIAKEPTKDGKGFYNNLKSVTGAETAQPVTEGRRARRSA
jgi:hypothetical protein